MIHSGKTGSVIYNTNNSGVNGRLGHIAANTGGTAKGNQNYFANTCADIINGDNLFIGVSKFSKGFYNHKLASNKVFVFSC